MYSQSTYDCMARWPPYPNLYGKVIFLGLVVHVLLHIGQVISAVLELFSLSIQWLWKFCPHCDSQNVKSLSLGSNSLWQIEQLPSMSLRSFCRSHWKYFELLQSKSSWTLKFRLLPSAWNVMKLRSRLCELSRGNLKPLDLLPDRTLFLDCIASFDDTHFRM